MADDKPRGPSLYPRWLSWIFVLFLAYILYQGNFGASHKPAAPVENKVAETPRDYPALRAFTDKDRWQRALNPTYVGSTTWSDVKEGEGKPVACGSWITVKLRGTTEDGANFDTSHDENKEMTFALGEAPYPALNNALIGMKVNGVRQVTAPPQLVYKEGVKRTRDSILLRVEMTHSDGTTFPPTMENKTGEGAGAACGEPVPVNLKVWDDKGSAAFTTASPVTLTPGHNEVARGIDAALVGLAAGGERTVVLTTLDRGHRDNNLNTTLIHALPKDRLAVVTVSREPAPKNK